MASIPITTLARVRAERDLKQRELAHALGILPATLSQVENRWRQPWPKLRRDASRLLGVPEAELFPPGELLPREAPPT